jgi:hypothetical protein
LRCDVHFLICVEKDGIGLMHGFREVGLILSTNFPSLMRCLLIVPFSFALLLR